MCAGQVLYQPAISPAPGQPFVPQGSPWHFCIFDVIESCGGTFFTSRKCLLGPLEHIHKATHARQVPHPNTDLREAEGSWPSVPVEYSKKGMALGKVQCVLKKRPQGSISVSGQRARKWQGSSCCAGGSLLSLSTGKRPAGGTCISPRGGSFRHNKCLLPKLYSRTTRR